MKKRVLSALLAICLTLSLAGAAFAENEHSGDSSSAVSQAVSSVESEPQTQDEMVSSGSVSGEDQTAAKTESTPAPTETPAASDVAEEEPESTPEPEAATEPDTTPAPTEDPVADVTENEESDGSVEYTAALETDGETMNVIVTAPEGAFAEGVQPKLSVTMLTAEDELNAVADKLKNAEVQYDGFTALDITFTDKATGEEVEPVKSVAVRIELPQAIVDSGIDLTTLAVQHLEEDENGNVQNVTEVATLDNGITLSEEAAAAANEAAGVAPMSNMPAEEATAGDATETPAAVAEFSVDGFSTFTITWNNGYTWAQNSTATVSIECFTTDNNSIPTTAPENINIKNGTTVTFDATNENLKIEGYTFNRAEYTTGNDTWNPLNTLQAKGTYHDRDYWTGYYTWNYVVNGNKTISSAPSIRIYYTKNESGGSGEGGDEGDTTVTNATVTTTKTADLRDDGSGNYDLTLSISGDRGSSSKKQKVDILFILDKSGSMNYSLNKDVDAGRGESSRMDLLQKAVSNLVDTVEQNDSIDARYGAVAFARSQQRQSESWTDASSIKAFVENLAPDGGTNYQQGIYDGEQLLNSKRAGALTFVIFVSDGEPTYRGIDVHNQRGDDDESPSDYGNGQNDDNGYNIAAAITEISNLTCDYFYAIGMGPEFGQDKWGYDKTGTKNLKNLANAVHATSKGDNNVFSASATDTLEQAFKDIAASVIFFAANDVTITDPLSNYADLVLTNGAPQFTITVTREASEGVEKKSWSGTVGPNGKVTFHNAKGEQKQATARVSDDNRTIYMDLPDDYELEPGYTYSISTVITPSETAKKLGMNNAAAQQTPDDNTGTHSIPDEDNNYSKDKGFWSNDNENAKVTFTANSEPGAQAFPKPVIQVTEEPTGSLQIVKDVQGIDGDVTAVVGNTTFTFKLEKVIPAEGGNDEYTLDDDFTDSTLGFTGGVKDNITITGKGQSNVISGLPEGWYRVTETDTGAVDADSDYEFVSNNGPVVVEVTKDNTSDAPVEATITNTYKHKDKTLTVIKTITGNMAYDQDTFQFTLNLIKDGSPYDLTGQLPSGVTKVNGVNGQYTFSLKAAVESNQVQFTLPYGVTATVTETPTDDYEEFSRQYQTGATTTLPAFDNDNTETFEMTSNRIFEFQNKKEIVTPPTGLERNDTPYALMISVAVMAGLALAGGAVVRRRRRWME